MAFQTELKRADGRHAAAWHSFQQHLEERLSWTEDPYPIERLERWARGMDTEAAEDLLELGEYLEPLLRSTGWWMTAVDVSAGGKSPGPLSQVRILAEEVLTLVVPAWSRTLIHSPHGGARTPHLMLVGRYVAFRRVVLDAIAAAWPTADLSELKKLA